MATSEEARLRRLDRLSQVLDTAIRIPRTNVRIGLDGIVGLIPGVGDSLGAVLSSYIILEAARLGFPKSVLLHMIGNVAIETVIGAVPILGDVFDIAWKANIRNLALLRASVAEPVGNRRSPRQIISVFVVMLIVAIVGLIALSLLLLRFAYQFITSSS